VNLKEVAMSSLQAIGDAEYYLELAREDYFLDGGEPPGQWFGRGAKALGLTGLVTPAQLKGLIAGFGPDGLPFENVDPKEAEEWARANIFHSSNNVR